MRRILGIHRPGPFHWVGDGFPVKTVFSYDNFGQQLSPFLLLDLRISGAVIAPYQQEIIRVNS